MSAHSLSAAQSHLIASYAATMSVPAPGSHLIPLLECLCIAEVDVVDDAHYSAVQWPELTVLAGVVHAFLLRSYPGEKEVFATTLPITLIKPNQNSNFKIETKYQFNVHKLFWIQVLIVDIKIIFFLLY